MKKRRMPLLVPVLWLIISCGWGYVLATDFWYGTSPAVLVVLHALTMLVSLTAAVVNYIRYKRQKD